MSDHDEKPPVLRAAVVVIVLLVGALTAFGSTDAAPGVVEDVADGLVDAVDVVEPSDDVTTTTGATTTTAVPGPFGPAPSLAAGEAPRVVVTPAGIVAPVLAVNPDGTFQVQTPCDAVATVTGTALAGAHVVLDPGHGGEESGAVGANGLAERDLNLLVARRVAEILRQAGATVVLTRDADIRMTLATRAGIATGLRPVAFLSIHHNAVADGPSALPGTEAYFQVLAPESRRLAGLVVEEVRAALTPFGGPWESDGDNGAKARVQSADPAADFYGVLRRTAGTTAVLSEAGFLSNPAEAELFARDDVQQAEAEALGRALTRFVGGESAGAAAFSTAPPALGGAGGGGGGTSGCVDPVL